MNLLFGREQVLPTKVVKIKSKSDLCQDSSFQQSLLYELQVVSHKFLGEPNSFSQSDRIYSLHLMLCYIRHLPALPLIILLPRHTLRPIAPHSRRPYCTRLRLHWLAKAIPEVLLTLINGHLSASRSRSI